jgi:hypothetical protein
VRGSACARVVACWCHLAPCLGKVYHLLTCPMVKREGERGERRVSMLMSEHHHSSVHARQMRCRQAHAYACTMLHASAHVHNAARKLPLLA